MRFIEKKSIFMAFLTASHILGGLLYAKSGINRLIRNGIGGDVKCVFY